MMMMIKTNSPHSPPGLAIPAAFHYSPGVSSLDVVRVSRISSLIIALTYVLFLVFQLYTHIDLFDFPSEGEDYSPSGFLEFCVLGVGGFFGETGGSNVTLVVALGLWMCINACVCITALLFIGNNIIKA